jgi:YidC/Oxa1 family membrane protein insertase
VQKNLLTFVVVSFAVLMGYTALVNYLRPTGELQIEVPEDVPQGMALKIESADGQTNASVDPSQRNQLRLRQGKYSLELSDAPPGWKLSSTQVDIERDRRTTIILAQTQDAAADPQAAPPEQPRPPNDPQAQADPPVDPAADPHAADPNAAPPEGELQPEPPHPPRWATLGSVDPSDPYRLLVTLTSRGGAIERIELSSDRYHDLDDRSGYLGHLAPTDSSAPRGALVNAVGRGTPAFVAGVRPGDIVTVVDGHPVGSADELRHRLAETRPREQIKLTVVRDGQPQQLPAVLERHPLQLVRPEVENSRLRKDEPATGGDDPRSMLLTLSRIGEDRRLDRAYAGELDGLDLLTGHWQLDEEAGQPDRVSFRRVLPKERLELVKTYRVARIASDAQPGPSAPAWHVTLSIEIKNLDEAPATVAYRLDGATGLPTEGAWYAFTEPRSYVAGVRPDAVGHVNHVEVLASQIVKTPDKNAGVQETETAPDRDVVYAGVQTQYFAAVVKPQIPDKSKRLAGVRPLVVGDVDEQRPARANISFRFHSLPQTIAPGQSHAAQFDLFAGPKTPDVLAAYELGALVDYGYFSWIAKPMQAILHGFYALVRNYGLAILLLTVVVRLCMFPLSRKQVLSAQKMQELAPEMQRINDKYKKDPQARNKALQELFRKHNYNPLGGCLLIFLQLPIFIGLYRALQLDVELRQAPLIPGLRWASNLAAPDMLYDWSAWMPRAVQDGWGYLLPGLGPYFNILPIITIVLFILQQKMFTPPPTNEQAAMTQKMMKYMMIFIGLLFYKVASGLFVYFIASSLWGLAERKLLPKTAAASGEKPAAEPPKSPDRKQPGRPATPAAIAAEKPEAKGIAGTIIREVKRGFAGLSEAAQRSHAQSARAVGSSSDAQNADGKRKRKKKKRK